jgi:hypothetical protein
MRSVLLQSSGRASSSSRRWHFTASDLNIGRENSICGRARLASDYSEIKIRLKFAPNAPAPNFETNWDLAPTEPMLAAKRADVADACTGAAVIFLTE